MLDRTVLDWVLAHRTPWLTDAFTVITTLGNTVVVAAATLIVAVVLAVRGRRLDGVAVVAVMFAGWGLMNGIKYAVRRSRPPIPERLVEISTYSFPSGHAMMSAMFATVVILLVVRSRESTLFRKSVRYSVIALAVIASAAIGLSRVYLGAHWLTDVVAGWLIGVVWVFGVRWVVVVSGAPRAYSHASSPDRQRSR